MNFLNYGTYFVGYKTSAGSFKNDEGEVVDYDNILMYFLTINKEGSMTSFSKVKRAVFSPYIDNDVAPDVETLLDSNIQHRCFLTVDSSSKNKDIIFVEFHPSSQVNFEFSM